MERQHKDGKEQPGRESKETVKGVWRSHVAEGIILEALEENGNMDDPPDPHFIRRETEQNLKTLSNNKVWRDTEGVIRGRRPSCREVADGVVSESRIDGKGTVEEGKQTEIVPSHKKVDAATCAK